MPVSHYQVNQIRWFCINFKFKWHTAICLRHTSMCIEHGFCFYIRHDNYVLETFIANQMYTSFKEKDKDFKFNDSTFCVVASIIFFRWCHAGESSKKKAL